VAGILKIGSLAELPVSELEKALESSNPRTAYTVKIDVSRMILLKIISLNNLPGDAL
jgi:hypothetical protein